MNTAIKVSVFGSSGSEACKCPLLHLVYPYTEGPKSRDHDVYLYAVNQGPWWIYWLNFFSRLYLPLWITHFIFPFSLQNLTTHSRHISPRNLDLRRVGLRSNRRIIRIRRIFVEFGRIKLILYWFDVRSNFYIKYSSNIRRFVEFFLCDLSINTF
jgi:hypothetical protein